MLTKTVLLTNWEVYQIFINGFVVGIIFTGIAEWLDKK